MKWIRDTRNLFQLRRSNHHFSICNYIFIHKKNVMGTYAIIEIGDEQFWVKLGRFYDVHHFTPSKPNLLGHNAKVLIYWLLMIRHETMINIGHPWFRGVVIKGRILHFCLGDKIIIYKMCPKKNTWRKSKHWHTSAWFVVNSIHLNEEILHK